MLDLQRNNQKMPLWERWFLSFVLVLMAAGSGVPSLQCLDGTLYPVRCPMVSAPAGINSVASTVACSRCETHFASTKSASHLSASQAPCVMRVAGSGGVLFSEKTFFGSPALVSAYVPVNLSRQVKTIFIGYAEPLLSPPTDFLKSHYGRAPPVFPSV